MSISSQIKDSFKTALKNKDQVRLEAIRLVMSEIKNLEIKKKGSEVKDLDIVKMIQKQIKQYQETIEQYVESGRSKEAEVDLSKVEILKAFLPAPVSDEQLNTLVTESISALGAKDLKDQGLVIKEVQSRTMGAVDGVKIVDAVRRQLK